MKRCVASVVADEDPTREADAAATRRSRSPAAPLGVDRGAGAEDGLEGFVLERILYFDASAAR